MIEMFGYIVSDKETNESVYQDISNDIEVDAMT